MNIIVLKFGGSVLQNADSFDSVQGEIQRFIDQGYKVIVVVSAFFGVTEMLLASAHDKEVSCDSVAYAELIASGELASANALEVHLVAASISTIKKTPREIEFLAVGKRDAALPLSVNSLTLRRLLQTHDVIIIPGFSAVDENGDCILLGRGGSDISAVATAQSLGLKSVRLLKDVDGLYDVDPNIHSNATRLASVDYKTALDIGGVLIQPEAILFAQSRDIDIVIAGLGKDYSTVIGN